MHEETTVRPATFGLETTARGSCSHAVRQAGHALRRAIDGLPFAVYVARCPQTRRTKSRTPGRMGSFTRMGLERLACSPTDGRLETTAKAVKEVGSRPSQAVLVRSGS